MGACYMYIVFENPQKSSNIEIFVTSAIAAKIVQYIVTYELVKIVNG